MMDASSAMEHNYVVQGKGGLYSEKKKKKKAVEFIFKQSAGNLWEISASNCHPWDLNSAVMACERMLQMLLGMLLLSDLAEKIYRARSPSTEYREYQLFFFFFHTCTSKNQKWGLTFPSLAAPYGLCSPGQVIVHPQSVEVTQIVWTEEKRDGNIPFHLQKCFHTCRTTSRAVPG